MINVLNDVKLKYKDPDTPKRYLVSLRDTGTVLQNEDILTESLNISESICSASSFKVGLCESSVGKVTVNYPDNVNGDEMSIIQILGNADLSFAYPENWTKEAMTISGDVTPVALSASETFDPLKYYLLSIYTEYIGKTIYIYLMEANGTPRMIYYLNPSMYGFAGLRAWDASTEYHLGETVLHNERVWVSRTEENLNSEPVVGNNAWNNVTKRMNILLPIIGYDFQSCYRQFYVPEDVHDGASYSPIWAKLYEISYPVMPLGLYSITSSKKRNDIPLRELQGYDRMQDTRLSTDVNYVFDTASTTIGEVLNDAVKTTQIGIGANLSKTEVTANVIENTTVSVPNFPTGTIYTVVQEETVTVQGTVSYDSTGSYTVREWMLVPRYYNSDYTIRYEGWSLIDTPITQGGRVYVQSTEEYWDFKKGGTTPEKDYGRGVVYYYEDLKYNYTWPAEYSSGWTVVSETYTNPDNNLPSSAHDQYGTVIPGIYITPGTCTRVYKRTIYSGSWSESVVGRKVRYQIPNYNPYDADTNPSGYIYDIFYHNPLDYGAIPAEASQIYDTIVQPHIDDGGTAGANNIANQQAVINAIYEFSTHDVVVPNENGIFEIIYVSRISYSGSDNGQIDCPNLLRTIQARSVGERFNDYPIGVTDNALHTTRRHVISSYLELNGLFINFNRYGISSFLTIASSSLYPAENLFPKDPEGDYGSIYPSEGAQEILTSSYCRSIEIDDDINPPFDGIKITSSNENAQGFPFYFNRLDRKYGIPPYDMQQIGYYETNNYYEISGNFFFDYFTFTQQQLISICETIMERIGDLQYFNLLAEIQALPYMEPGDNINIKTKENGYETAILRRTMSGCIAQKDTIETDFY